MRTRSRSQGAPLFCTFTQIMYFNSNYTLFRLQLLRTHARVAIEHENATVTHAQFATLCRYDRFRNLKSGKL